MDLPLRLTVEFLSSSLSWFAVRLWTSSLGDLTIYWALIPRPTSSLTLVPLVVFFCIAGNPLKYPTWSGFPEPSGPPFSEIVRLAIELVSEGLIGQVTHEDCLGIAVRPNLKPVNADACPDQAGQPC